MNNYSTKSQLNHFLVSFKGELFALAFFSGCIIYMLSQGDYQGGICGIILIIPLSATIMIRYIKSLLRANAAKAAVLSNVIENNEFRNPNDY